MIKVYPVLEKEIKELSALASAVVKEHYDPILGATQNDYMIELFQSEKGLKEQIAHGYRYYWIEAEGDRVGFFAVTPKEGMLYLCKYYIQKQSRGKGAGSYAMNFIKDMARKEGYRGVFLNVNKYNDNSIAAYKHMGFQTIRAEKNPIGNGYYMDDYVLEYLF